MTRKLDIDDIQKVVVTETALGIDRKVTEEEVLNYIDAGSYYIRDEGSIGYDVVVFDDCDFKIRVSLVMEEQVEEPDTTIVRGGKL